MKQLFILLVSHLLLQGIYAQNCFDSFLNEGIKLYNLHNYDAAKKQFDAAAECKPQNENILIEWKEKTQLALATIWAKDIPTQEKIYVNLVQSGESLFETKNYQNAIIAYQKAQNISDSFEPYFNNTFDSLIKIRITNSKKAIEILFIELCVKKGDSLMNLAELTQKAGYYIEAYNYYLQAQQKGFDSLIVNDKINQNIELLRKNVGRIGNLPKKADIIGLSEIYLSRNEDDLAEKYIKKAIELKFYPGSPRPLFSGSQKLETIVKKYQDKAISLAKWEVYLLGGMSYYSFIKDKAKQPYFLEDTKNLNYIFWLNGYRKNTLEFSSARKFGKTLGLGFNYRLNAKWILGAELKTDNLYYDIDMEQYIQEPSTQDTLYYHYVLTNRKNYSLSCLVKRKYFIFNEFQYILPYVGISITKKYYWFKHTSKYHIDGDGSYDYWIPKPPFLNLSDWMLHTTIGGNYIFHLSLRYKLMFDVRYNFPIFKEFSSWRYSNYYVTLNTPTPQLYISSFNIGFGFLVNLY